MFMYLDETESKYKKSTHTDYVEVSVSKTCVLRNLFTWQLKKYCYLTA
jgi:hypothetical protein